MSDETAIPREQRNRILYTGFGISLLGLLTSIGVLRFLVLATLAHDFGSTPVELVAEPLCLAALVLALRDRHGRGSRLKRLTVIFDFLGAGPGDRLGRYRGNLPGRRWSGLTAHRCTTLRVAKAGSRLGESYNNFCSHQTLIIASQKVKLRDLFTYPSSVSVTDCGSSEPST